MDNWAPYQTKDGRIYFFNKKTGESSWERPSSLTSNYQFERNKFHCSNTGQINSNKNKQTFNQIDAQSKNYQQSFKQNLNQWSNKQYNTNYAFKQQALQRNNFTYKQHPQISLHNKKTYVQKHYYSEKFNKSFTSLKNEQNSHEKQKKPTKQLLSYLDDLSKTQQSPVKRTPPGFNQKKQINLQSETFQFNTNQEKVELTKKPKIEFKKGDIILAPYELDKKKYPAKILDLYQEKYIVYWLEQKIQSKVSIYDVSSYRQVEYLNERAKSSKTSNTSECNSNSEKVIPLKRTETKIQTELNNFGAIRHLEDVDKWQARDRDGNVLETLFSTYEDAEKYLIMLTQQKHVAAKIIKPKQDASINKRIPSPPAYIAPMPDEFYTDNEEEYSDNTSCIERPVGREIIFPDASNMERLAVTSSVEMRSLYAKGFEEWKPSQKWAHEDAIMRLKISNMFRKIFRTAIFTANGTVYTQLLNSTSQDANYDELTMDGVIFKKFTRLVNKPKFLIRLQHALEHQLAIVLHKANFTRISGETTPMYVFMNQSSGQSLKLQGGKEIINFCGIIPHVKVRNESESHLELVPSEKSFLKKTIRDLLVTGKNQKAFYKDSRGFVRTKNKLVTLTIASISNELVDNTKDPTTSLTVREMAMKRGQGMILGYNDAVVVETSHGLFSSDEIHPIARLSKKEQASRDKILGKDRYIDRQRANKKIIDQFKAELCEAIKRHNIGLEIGEKYIYAPCTYLREVQIRRPVASGENEIIGSKSRHHEWDRLLRKEPQKLKMKKLLLLIDRSFTREKKNLLKLFRAVIKRRPWIPEPTIIATDLNEITKIWNSRITNRLKYNSLQPIEAEKINEYFSQFGLIVNMKEVDEKNGIINFRNSSCVIEVLQEKTHTIDEKEVRVESFLELNRHQQKICGEAINGITNADSIMILLPGKEGSSRVTHMKNKLTMMINGEEGLNHGALQFVMQTNMRTNSKKSYAILQEALEAGLVPKTGAITFEIAQRRCDYDLIIAIDISQEQEDFKVASLVTTITPFEGSIDCMHAVVTLVDAKGMKGDIIPYQKMKQLLEKIRVNGKNIIIYRHNCSIEYKEVFQNEIQATLDHFSKDSHISFIQVSSTSSLRILDVQNRDLGSKQAKGEFVITKKVTQTWKKMLEFYVRHIEKSNPVKYSIIYSTNRELLTHDEEVVELAIFTHNMTKNYVHHKDGSKLPGPLKYADHNARLYSSIIRTMKEQSIPKFHPKSLRPKIV